MQKKQIAKQRGDNKMNCDHQVAFITMDCKGTDISLTNSVNIYSLVSDYRLFNCKPDDRNMQPITGHDTVFFFLRFGS